MLFALALPAGAAEVTDAPAQRPMPAKPKPHKAKPVLKAKKKPSDGVIGKASLYGNFHGKRTASGERYDRNGLTAAHRTLPFDSNVRVTNLANGRSVTVKVNDRGPHRKDRVIDLSQGAAEQLGMKRQGLATVRVEPAQTAGLPRN